MKPTITQADIEWAERAVDELQQPMIFVINFGKVLSVPALDKLASEADAAWSCTQANFTHENPHADQVRHSLRKMFDEIMEYAETGVLS